MLTVVIFVVFLTKKMNRKIEFLTNRNFNQCNLITNSVNKLFFFVFQEIPDQDFLIVQR
jgi:hypothetical protein